MNLENYIFIFVALIFITIIAGASCFFIDGDYLLGTCCCFFAIVIGLLLSTIPVPFWNTSEIIQLHSIPDTDNLIYEIKPNSITYFDGKVKKTLSGLYVRESNIDTYYDVNSGAEYIEITYNRSLLNTKELLIHMDIHHASSEIDK